MTLIGTTNPGDERFDLASAVYWFMFPEHSTPGLSSSSPFAPKGVTGDRSYSDYDAVSAAAWAELKGGMGQDRASDMTRYYNAIGVDARGGRTILGPLVTEEALTAGSLLNEETLNYTNVWTRWHGSSHSWVNIVAIPDPDARFQGIILPAGWTTIDRIWLALRIPVGAMASPVVTVEIYSDHGDGTPDYPCLASTTMAVKDVNTVGNWTQAVFASPVALTPGTLYWVGVINNQATAIQWGMVTESDIGIYDVWFHDPLIRPDSPPHLFFGVGEDLATRLWAAAGRYLYWMDGATPTIAEDGASAPKRLEADIQDAFFWKASGDSYPYVYIALGDSQDMQKFDANIGAEQWAAIKDIKAERLCAYDDMLWRLYGDNQISGSTDGETWGNPVTVGNKVYPARNLIGWQGFLWVGCDDGLYRVTYPAGYPAAEATPEVSKVLDFTYTASPINFSFMVEHQTDLFFNLANGVIQYTLGGVVRSIGPETGLNIASSERNVYRAAVSTVGALWVASEGPLDDTSSILSYAAGAWHPLIVSPRMGDMVRSLCIDPGYYSYGNNPRLYFGAGLSVAYAEIPLTTERRWLWSEMEYLPYGIIDLPWFDGNIRTINKDWVSVEIHATGVGTAFAAGKVYAYARLSESTAWSAALDVGVVDTAGITRLLFPAASYSAKIQLRLKLYRGTTETTTPNVEAVVLRYVERPQDLKAFTRTYLLATRQQWRNGTPFKLSLAQQVTQLETLRNSPEPLTWHPWFGGSYSVHIVDYNGTEVPDERIAGADPVSILVTVRLQVIE